jgi:hypothetical protein
LKPVPAWHFVALLCAGQLMPLLYAALATLLIVALSLPLTGAAAWAAYGQKVPDLLRGGVIFPSISLPAFHARLFLPAGFQPVHAVPPMAPVTALNAAAFVAGLVLLARLGRRVRARREPGPDGALALCFGLGLTLSALLAAMAWQHYATWLLVPLAAALQADTWLRWRRAGRILYLALLGVAFGLLNVDDEPYARLLGGDPGMEAFRAGYGVLVLGVVLLAAALAFALAALPPRSSRSAAAAQNGGPRRSPEHS